MPDSLGGAHVGGTEQQPEVGGVDGRGLDAHHDLVGTGRAGTGTAASESSSVPSFLISERS